MSICISNNCPMYGTCARAHTYGNTLQDSVDYMNLASGSTNSMKTDIEYRCGPYGGYRLYVRQPNTLTATAIVSNMKDLACTEPSRRCNICDELEYPGAEIVKGEFWICPDCCKKIQSLLKKEIEHKYFDGIMRTHE